MPALRAVRRALWIVIVAAMTLAPWPVEAAIPAAELAAPPNVLIVMTDDQRRSDTMGVMPFTRRWFGHGGTEYSAAFATTPLCCPARSTVMTGRYAHNTGVRNNQSALALDQRSTVQRYLQESGYRTGIFGKFLNKWPLDRDPPYFDDFAIFNAGYYNTRWNDGGTERTIARYSTRFIESKAVDFLASTEAEDDRPWFLMLTTSAPHSDAVPERRYAGAAVGSWPGNPAVSERDRTDKPPLVRSHWDQTLQDARRIRAAQLRTLMTVDDLVENVATRLEAAGEENTLAFFLSDNGVLWSEHGIYGKTWPYRQSIQIPMFVRWPGRTAPGVVDDRLVATIDLAPTILQAAGVTPDPAYPVDGRSLADVTPRDRLLIEYWRSADSPTGPWAGYIAPSFEYVEYLSEDLSRAVFLEYYDLAVDPWQLTNLLGDRRAGNDPDVTQLSADLARDRTCVGSACP